jgi:hypothetical protein
MYTKLENNQLYKSVSSAEFSLEMFRPVITSKYLIQSQVISLDISLFSRGLINDAPSARGLHSDGLLDDNNKFEISASRLLCLPPTFTLVSCLAHSSILKMETTCTFETSVDFQRTTRNYIPEDVTPLGSQPLFN